MTTDPARDLTGVWNGLYSYAGGDWVSFVATLVQSSRFVSGATHEVGIDALGQSIALTAIVDGACDGARVNFTKTYDGSGGWTHFVLYDGALDAEATEIEGVWTIPGQIAGRFLMIRSGGARAETTARIVERV